MSPQHLGALKAPSFALVLPYGFLLCQKPLTSKPGHGETSVRPISIHIDQIELFPDPNSPCTQRKENHRAPLLFVQRLGYVAWGAKGKAKVLVGTLPGTLTAFGIVWKSFFAF